MIRLNRELIRKALKKTRTNIFMFAGLSQLLQKHMPEWVVEKGKHFSNAALVTAQSFAMGAVIDGIVKAGVLKKAVLPFPYREDVRYLFGEPDLLDLVQSLSNVGYFTHLTAIHLNNLTEQIPKTIYFNVEQRTSGGTGQLTQDALDRALQGQAPPFLERGGVSRHAYREGKRQEHQLPRGLCTTPCQCGAVESNGLRAHVDQCDGSTGLQRRNRRRGKSV